MPRLLLVPVIAAVLAGSAAAATVRGTAHGDLIQAAFGGATSVRCGAGVDLAVVDRTTRVAADCETVVRRLSTDPFTSPSSQHETAVEPDSFAWGSTVVAAYQVGRFANGGSAGIGVSLSTDAGRSWRSSFLPGVTVASSPPGPDARASDPSVAYDALHAVWLVSSLTVTGNAIGIDISRSSDGLDWQAPTKIATGPGLDKEWLACDNGAASPFRGHCYAVYSDDAAHQLSTQVSTDGGATWSAPVATGTELVGAQPVILPDGTLEVIAADLPDNHGGSLLAMRSSDGGASFGPAALVSDLQWRLPRGMRAVPLPSATIDAAGTIVVAWHDCRFRPGCPVNDIVVASSTDGIAWTPPRRVPLDALGSGTDHFLTGLDADPRTAGRLGLVYAFFEPGSCRTGVCRLEIGFTSSTDGGETWTRQRRLDAVPMPLSWLASTTDGRMIGDYLSTSFAGGRAVPVFALAAAPLRGRFREAIFAASLALPTARR